MIISIVKLVVGVAASTGVGAIIGHTIKANVPTVGMNLLQKGATALGAVVLTAMVADKASDYVEDRIDSALEGVEKINEIAQKLKN